MQEGHFQEYIQIVINDGNPIEIMELGMIYEGKLRKINPFEYSPMYFRIKPNYQKSKEYYEMAIEKGNTDALLHLAQLYYYKLEDNQKALDLYELALQKKGCIDFRFMEHLMKIYHKENIYKTDINRILKNLIYSARNGDNYSKYRFKDLFASWTYNTDAEVLKRFPCKFYDYFTELYEKSENIIPKLEKENSRLKGKIEDLEYRPPLEGGKYYQIGHKNFKTSYNLRERRMSI